MATGRSLFALILIISLNCTFSSGQGIRFEAENARLGGALKIMTTIPGYSGTGYVGQFENDADILTFTVPVSTGGNFNLYVGYAAPFGDKINIVTINGNRSELQFRNGNSFREAAFGKCRLNQGDNLVVISKSWGWFLVDYIKIEPNTDPDIPFDISDTLVTPDPATFTVNEFHYLLDKFGKEIHSGVMDMKEAGWLQANTGKYPALLGLDLMNHTRNYSWFDKNILISEAREWYSKNGLLAVCWHWRDPLRKTEEFYTDRTTFDVSRITDTLSPEYLAMVSDIDIIAGYLKTLQQEEIPVLFRPLHEASGKWFWWGAKGPEPCKALWKLIFTRLTGKHQLKNLIWVWTTDAASDNLTWYPGNEYVDILGVDIYPPNGDFGSQILTFDKVREVFKGKKMITLSENGVIPDPENLTADECRWSWFMTWSGDFTRNSAINPLDYWKRVLEHPYVITRDEMPDRNGPSSVNLIPASPHPGKYRIVTESGQNCMIISAVDQTREYTVSIFDLNGRICAQFLHQAGGSEVSFMSPERGIFIVRLISGKLVENIKVAL